MAERRMFAKSVIDSDLFLDMPPTTQMLYFHLAMRADDDGFINNPKRIQRMIGASDDDMRILVAKRFILIFESGVIVIRHWKLHNYIQKDRYRPTGCDEKAQIELTDKKLYELKEPAMTGEDTECIQDCIQNDSNTDTVGIPNGYLGKDRLGKDRIGYIAAAARTRDTTSESDCQVVDEELSKCVKLFEDNIHTLTSIERESLLELYDEYQGEWLSEAIKEAVKGNGRSLRYIQAVLERWKIDGFKVKRVAGNGRRFSSNAQQHTENSAREGEKWANETDGWD